MTENRSCPVHTEGLVTSRGDYILPCNCEINPDPNPDSPLFRPGTVN